MSGMCIFYIYHFFFGNDNYVLYVCLMKKKSDILLSRLKSDFRLIRYEQIKRRRPLRNVGDDELVLIRGADLLETLVMMNWY